MAQEQPKKMTTKADGKLESPMLVIGKAGEFDFLMDEPQYLGGTNKGMSPMEAVTAALVGCSGITLAVVAQQMGFQYRGVEFHAEGDIDLRGFMGMPGVCRHFCDFRGTFIVDTDESDERMNMVAELVENRCPVFNLLHDAGVQTNIEWKKK